MRFGLPIIYLILPFQLVIILAFSAFLITLKGPFDDGAIIAIIFIFRIQSTPRGLWPWLTLELALLSIAPPFQICVSLSCLDILGLPWLSIEPPLAIYEPMTWSYPPGRQQSYSEFASAYPSVIFTKVISDHTCLVTHLISYHYRASTSLDLGN